MNRHLEVPNCLLRIFDYLFGCIFIGALVISFWRGTWLLMDIYIFPGSTFKSACMCTAIGFVFSSFILFMQGWIVNKLSNYDKITLKIVWKICIYLIAVSCVSFWRGVWILTDQITGLSLTSFLLSHGISFIILTLTRTTCSIVSSPGYYLRDKRVTPMSSFNLNSMNINFTNQVSDKMKMFASHILTVCIIGPTVVCYWRGTWMLMIYLTDMYLNTELQRCVVSISLGYVTCLVCFLISEPLENKLTGSSLRWSYSVKVFLEHVFVYVLGFGTVNVWSGAWCLWDFYCIQGKDNKELIALLMHCVTVTVLYIGQGATNLIGAPVGCRTHGNNTLEGLYMGTFFRITEPKVIGRQDITDRKDFPCIEELTESNAIQETEPLTESNAIQMTEETELGVTCNEN